MIFIYLSICKHDISRCFQNLSCKIRGGQKVFELMTQNTFLKSWSLYRLQSNLPPRLDNDPSGAANCWIINSDFAWMSSALKNLSVISFIFSQRNMKYTQGLMSDEYRGYGSKVILLFKDHRGWWIVVMETMCAGSDYSRRRLRTST